LRGKELLERAEVLIYDGLVNRELLRFAPPTAEIIYGGKHDRTRCVSQAELNALLLAKGLEGKCVVRLKGGDPSYSAAVARRRKRWPQRASPSRWFPAFRRSIRCRATPAFR